MYDKLTPQYVCMYMYVSCYYWKCVISYDKGSTQLQQGGMYVCACTKADSIELCSTYMDSVHVQYFEVITYLDSSE